MKTVLFNEDLIATINHKGAEVISLKSKVNNKEFIWEGNPEIWGKHSPVLFPIVGTLKDNTYIYDNITYNLSRHGFARDSVFNLIYNDSETAVFSLKSSNETRTFYPFDFELQIKYSLVKTKLFVHYTVSNLNDCIMPFCIGAHPAFALPKNFNNYSLEFDASEKLEYHQLENDLINNSTSILETKENKITLSYDLFSNDALIFKTLKSKKITILENNIPYVKISYNDFDSLGIWTKVDAPFVCIEPWIGYSDTVQSTGKILEKEAIRLLNPNDSAEFEFNIEIFN